MTKVFLAWPCGRFIEIYRATSAEKNFIERKNPTTFYEADLATEIMQKPQSNLEEKVNPSILKDDFS